MLILVIAALALLLAFAFAGPDWSDLLSPARNELVFAERNRAYGAYRLRREHGRVLGVSAVIALAVTTLALVLPRVLSEPTQLLIPQKRTVEVILKEFVVPTAEKKDVQVIKTKIVPSGGKPNRDDLPPIAVEDTLDHTILDTTETSLPGDRKDTLGTVAVVPPTPPGGGGGTDAGKTPIKTIGMDQAEVSPEYPGGIDGLHAFLRKNIDYPEVDRRAGRQGRVMVGFVVDEEGHVTNIKVLSGVSVTIDAEAVRVVERMARWKPGRHHGEPVRVYYQLPIGFRMPN